MPERSTRRRSGRLPRAGLSGLLATTLAALVGLVLAIGPVTATDPAPAVSGNPSASPAVSPGPSDSPPPSGAPSPDPTPTPPPPPPPPPTVTFFGRGYGHGLGLSQYGAYGRAIAGETAPAILAHYYANTTLATLSPTAGIRVLLMTGFRPTPSVPARVIGLGGKWTVDGVRGSWPAGASVTLVRVTRPAPGWRLRFASATGGVLRTMAAPATVRIRPAAASARLQVWFKPSYYDTYRGVIRLAGSTGGSITVINELSMEQYLPGVVPCEMPSSWPVEALRAQAIAARSYAAAHRHPTVGSWDVYEDTRSQVYRGVLAERSTSSAAIASTAGQVIRTSTGAIANALFHSSDGGATENNENVYVSPTGARMVAPASYLRGSGDRTPTGTAFDATSPRATWQTAAYTWEQLSRVFAADPRTNVGTLTGLDLSHRGVSGRVISVTLSGSGGSKTVSGEIFRSVFNTYTPATDPYMWGTLIATTPIP